MNRKKLWNIAKTILKIGFSIFALWLVYTHVDFGAITLLWKHATVWYFIPALLAYVISQVTASYRLLYFFRDIGLSITVKENMRLYLKGLFYNLFLPGGIGGDGYKILVLERKYKYVTHKDVFSAVFFDRLAGMWALVGLLIASGLLLPQVRVYYGYAVAAFMVGSLIYFFVIKRFFPRMGKHFLRKHIFGACVQAMQLLCVFFILLALGCTTNFLSYFAIFLMSAIASLFPFSVGGLGAREIVIMWGATTFGLNKDLAVSVSLCYYVISMLTALTAIFIIFQKSTEKNEQ